MSGAPPRPGAGIGPVIPAALAAQAGGLLAAVVCATLAQGHIEVPWMALAIAQGVVAALIAALLRQRRWWLAIHAMFVPSALAAYALQIDARWYLAGFIALALVFGGVHRSRVPLFLSNDRALLALLELLPRDRELRFLDLGCGVGSVLARVSRERPLAWCTGVESAPLPALVARMRTARRVRCRIARADFWSMQLSRFDVVYAYLSPAAMPALWSKAKREMKPGALLISNAFAVPSDAPGDARPLGETRHHSLFVYRM